MLKLLFNLDKMEIRKMIGASVCFAVSSLCGAAAILTALHMIFGAVRGTVDNGTVKPYIAAVGLLLLSQAAAAALGDWLNHSAGFSLVKRLRQSITLKLQQFSMAFYTREQLAEVSSVIHKDVDTMEMVIAHLWSRMFASIAVSAVLGAYLFTMEWRLGAAMALCIPIALIVLASGTRKRQKAHASNLSDNTEMLGLFLEFTKGMPILKSYKKNASLQRRLDSSVKKFGISSTRLANSIAVVSGHYFVWLEISFAVVVTFGAYIVLGGALTPEEYIIFAILSKEFIKPFASAESYYVNYIMVKSSYDRIRRITDSPVLTDNGTGEFPQSSSISFEEVSFSYKEDKKERFEISSISLTVPHGTMTALVGPSGSGKTTMTNLLLRFYDPHGGSIRIGGIDIRDIRYNTLLTNIAVVMQDVFIFSGTIYENLLMGNEAASREQAEEAARQAMIHDEIMEMPKGYDTIVGERGTGLSGGQKQRLSIARAFLKGAEIIVLDEATSNVDPINEQKIQKAISNLAKNRTVLIVAHHLRAIKNVDQIVVMEKGKIAEVGRHSELLDSKGLYCTLWNAQNKPNSRKRNAG
ncbi:ATP-binding cassette subfamily B protein [Anaerobacterium chartisolvens]|uniref:ATP-binding cassette subfamily B protein n=1 Tax=Anaerobacterium chartisolvens TaxID=1297424 RepID=A0A369BE25_9FIRM|nr:ABC transporter ATP-binding protein [Anaerobacterium chartisolvens]RCX18836.1 ATP-binding cassette subfamily B protein [Anaerobacterium chartisolvens]